MIDIILGYMVAGFFLVVAGLILAVLCTVVFLALKEMGKRDD